MKKNCSKCKKEVDILELFSGDLCLACYEKNYSKLTEKEKKPIFDKSLINKSLVKKNKIMTKEIKKRLEYLRKQIENENMSYGEIAELQGLAEYIDKGDIILLEWAGVKE